jgi:hypothetical protein
MNREKNKQVTTLTFESFDEFVTMAKLPPPDDDRGSREESRSRDAWFGSRTFDEAVEMARDGWPKGAAAALKARKTVDQRVAQLVSAKASQWGFDVVGDVVDIGRYLTGEPECWLTEQDGENGRARVVKFLFNVCCSAAVQPEAMISRGAAILAAIDAIEASGTRCEVWFGYSAKKHCEEEQLDIVVPVKYAGQPLDQDRLAFALASPSCSRRLCFSVAEQERYSPSGTTPSTIKTGEGTVYLDSICRGTAMSEKEVEEEVIKICKSAGVTL